MDGWSTYLKSVTFRCKMEWITGEVGEIKSQYQATVFGQTNQIDPYDLAAQDWITDPHARLLLPGYYKWSCFWTESIYTEAAYEQFLIGWVRNILISKPANCKSNVTVILTKLRQHSFLSPVIKQTKYENLQKYQPCNYSVES